MALQIMKDEPTNQIPKIIHQIWDKGEIPNKWTDCVQSWKRMNPEFEYKLWDDKKNRAFVNNNYPEFLDIYDSYPYDIMRIDAVRCFILFHYGGLYVDIDFECIQPVGPLLKNKSFIIGLEPISHARIHGRDFITANGFMASVPNHGFLKQIISRLKTSYPKISTYFDVLYTTGPLMVSKELKKYNHSDFSMLNSHIVYPFGKDSPELEKLFKKTDDFELTKKKCIENGTCAIHYWDGSWADDVGNELDNPDPFNVQGYRFYSGMDSPGFVLKVCGKNIDRLISECNKNKKALGFSTSGHLKYHIAPFYRWTKIGKKGENQGLYIKVGWENNIRRWLQWIYHLQPFVTLKLLCKEILTRLLSK